jgi:putative photosynthetic complex assembly protein 2
LFTVFLWWFSTGLIMAVYGRSPVVIRGCYVASSVMMLAALVGLVMTRSLQQPLDVYVALMCGIVIWGWQVSGYYLGFVTGPESSRGALDDDKERSLLERFRLALYFGIYHELLVLGLGVVIALLTWSHANKWGLWMYLALWLMHTSAKVNVFLGVRNFRIELLPQEMHHLDGLLSERNMNAMVPFSIILVSSIGVLMLFNGISPDTEPIHRIGFISIATMMGLGLLEHWLLILPLPATLWGWGIRSVPKRKVTPPDCALKGPARSVPEQAING